jgi:hypothetical protein
MNITLKNVPVKLHRALKKAAKKQDRSLNAQIIHMLKTEAEQLERRQRAAEWREKVDRLRESLPPMDDSASLIREDRESHSMPDPGLS